VIGIAAVVHAYRKQHHNTGRYNLHLKACYYEIKEVYLSELLLIDLIKGPALEAFFCLTKHYALFVQQYF
jgi:hypothetical protein